MEGLLTDEEINALFNSNQVASDDSSSSSDIDQSLISSEERDAIGEISNISMGTSATTLASLVGGLKVDISTPTVSIINWDVLSNSYDKPCVFIEIFYKEGLHGNNILILQEKDVKVIASLMMGGDGSIDDGEELNEMHLSAIAEAMNQMMGSASTSISQMLETKVDISPPIANLVTISEAAESEELKDFLTGNFVKVAFKMVIGDLINSELMQLYPIEFAKSLYSKFAHTDEAVPETKAPETFATETKAVSEPQSQPQMQPQMGMGMPQGMPQMQPQMMGMQPQMMGMPMYQQPMAYQMPPVQDVNIAPANFQPFMMPQSPLLSTENIDLLLDVPLEVTVELGRTSKSIKEILDFAPGTIVELNRLAGEPIDILVNGKYVAKGEVVVIEEAFGIRITEVIK
ncbi:MAG: flagellar motor switch phosphatase FliY [Lachnospiraceae bacterium]|nr:flagellar motor switch phosphatase FliY [Lachnospiraceae bacterium]